jgi:hypothetical protein
MDLVRQHREKDNAMKMDSAGWIKWSGGSCPVDPEYVVQTRYRNMLDSAKAKDINWSYAMSYRIVSIGVNDVVSSENRSTATKASELLKKAAQLMDERGKQYDKPEGERSMGKCVAAFNVITEKNLTEAEGWLLLQILKDVRLWQRPGYHQDSAEDCIAYAALKAEAKQNDH